MAITPGVVPQDAFDFALSHALSLAEAGRTMAQKRMGTRQVYGFVIDLTEYLSRLYVLRGNYACES